MTMGTGMRKEESGMASVQHTQLVKERKERSRLEEEALLFRQLQEEAAQLASQRRECPVPKPKGVVGRLLGFDNSGQGGEEAVRAQRYERTTEVKNATRALER